MTRSAGLAASAPICTLTETVLPSVTGVCRHHDLDRAGLGLLDLRHHSADRHGEGLAVQVQPLDDDLVARHGHVGLDPAHLGRAVDPQGDRLGLAHASLDHDRHVLRARSAARPAGTVAEIWVGLAEVTTAT